MSIEYNRVEALLSMLNCNKENLNKDEKDIIIDDQHAMDLALELSEKRKYLTHPNPHVGCLIVKDNKILAQGFHYGAGHPHAEVEAYRNLDSLQISDEDAIVYVTLEPCNHYGRTPPCTDLLLKRKPKRIVIGIIDPDPQVSGQGIEKLRKAGIEVDILHYSKVASSLKEYIHHRSTGLPYIILKLATSLNGKVQSKTKYITSESARRDVHVTRSQADMILTTKSTLYADKPKLNVRLDGKEYDKPVACISRHCMTSEEKDEITKFATEVCGIAKFEILDNFSIDTLRALASRGIIRILTEGGPNLVDSFYKEGFWNQFDLYIDSCVLPDDLLGWIKPLSLGQINSSQIFGSSIKLSYLKQ